MSDAEVIRDKRFIPQTEGAIKIGTENGREIKAYPGTFLHAFAQRAKQQLAKEAENGREKTASD